MKYIIIAIIAFFLYIIIRLWWALRHDFTDFDQPTKREFMGKE
jgi:nitrogen fixation-related uncharacterized protein